MSGGLRRALLASTALVGLYVGGWAAFAPQGFYDLFPGLGLIWVAVDGPFNEHLVRDVGALYLGLAAATVLAALQREVTAAVAASRTVGVAWVVFSVPHLGYHLLRLDGLGALDAVAQVLALSSTVVLGGLLMLGPLPARGRGRARDVAAAP